MKVVAAVTVAACVCAAGLIASDIAADRAMKVSLAKSVPMHADWESVWDDSGRVISTVGPVENLPVLRVRYGKDFMAIRVRRVDGVDGWIRYDQDVQVVE